MTLKTLICPSCCGKIETFDETTKKGFCPFCDCVIADVQEKQRAFAVSADGKVNVDGVESQEELFSRAQTFASLDDYAVAEQLLEDYTFKYPQDFKGWESLFFLNKPMFEIDYDPRSRDTDNGAKRLGDSLAKMLRLAKTSSESATAQECKEWLDCQRDNCARAYTQIIAELSPMEREADALRKEAEIFHERERSSKDGMTDEDIEMGKGGVFIIAIFAAFGAMIPGFFAPDIITVANFVGMLIGGFIGFILFLLLARFDLRDYAKQQRILQEQAMENGRCLMVLDARIATLLDKKLMFSFKLEQLDKIIAHGCS